ncbi:MAG: DEAD/DEAH box helicase [Flavobacteriaceae bacterium]
MSAFTHLGVKKEFVKSLKELQITTPTEIQEKTIPLLLKSKKDFIGLAQTGTGKTAAFGLPILHKVDANKPEVQALILSPTRELVQQIKKQLFKFTKYSDNRIFLEAVFGGEKIDKQLKNLERTTHIIVATPGRLLDLIKRGAIDLSNVKTVVLDEADEMLSMGFKKELDAILTYTRTAKSTWLFSATMPEGIKRIIKTYMASDAIQIAVNANTIVNSNISHQYIKTSLQQKTADIMEYLTVKGQGRGIIFCKTKLGTQALAKELLEDGFSVAALEGDMTQKERDKVMRAFKNEMIQILVSTDVSARGIDVKDLEYVIHHQLPDQLEYYTHRSGRTARAGQKGKSVAFVLPVELERIFKLQKALGIKFNEKQL